MRLRSNNFIELNRIVVVLALTFCLLSCQLTSPRTASKPTSPPEPPPAKTGEMLPTQVPPTASPTVEPTATLAPTLPEPTSVADLIEVWDYTYSEDFSNSPEEWSVEPYQDEDVSIQYKVENGVFTWDVKAVNDVSMNKKAVPEIPLPDGDFLLSVSVQVKTDAGSAPAGLLFRFQDFDNFYYAKLDTDGEVGLFARQEGKWEKLAESAMSDHFLPGQVNRLIVVEESGKYQVQVNDYPVLYSSDDRFSGGSLGLIIELYEGTQAVYTFDDLRVMQPGGSAALDEDEPGALPTMVGMGASWDIYSAEFNGMKYTFEHPFAFQEVDRTDNMAQFCLEGKDDLCIMIQAKPSTWDSAEVMANELMDQFSQNTDTYEVLNRSSTTTTDGYASYWVQYAFEYADTKGEGSRLFVIVENNSLDLSAWGKQPFVEVYRPVIKSMMESLSISMK